MANIPVTITSPSAGVTIFGGSPTIDWTLPPGTTQTLYQIGAWRVSDRVDGQPLNAPVPPFSAHPVAGSGYPSLPYGTIPDPTLVRTPIQQFTFDGSYPSTAGLPNGTYIVWLHVIVEETNDQGEVLNRDNGVATVQFTVRRSTVPEPRRIPNGRGSQRAQSVAPPEPIITAPTAGQALTSGTVAFGVQLPADLAPYASEIKIAIYDATTYDPDSNRNHFPVVYTDRAPYDAPALRAAEWIDLTQFPVTLVGNISTWTITFDGSEGTAQIPNGSWAAAVRYNADITARVIAYDPRTGFERAAHRFIASERALRYFTVSGSFDPPDLGDPFVYVPFAVSTITWPRNRIRNEVASPLCLRWQYHNQRGVGQQLVIVRRNLTGGTNQGTRYLGRTTAGEYQWVGRIGNGVVQDGKLFNTYLPLRGEELALSPGADVRTGWGALAWGTHTFFVRPRSYTGVQGAQSDPLIVDVYRRLSISTFTVDVNSGGHIRCRWTHDGSTGNNGQGRYRIQVFDTTGARQLVSGSSERPEDRNRPDIPARAIRGTNLSFTLNHDLPSKGVLPNGTYRVVLTLWDRYGNRSEPTSREVTLNNTAPPAVTLTPRVYDHNDVAQPQPTPYVQGYIRGEYVGVAFSQLTAAVREVLLQRREFRRRDGGELNDEPFQIARLPLGSGTTYQLARWNDETVIPNRLYEYRGVTIASTGAQTEGAWTP